MSEAAGVLVVNQWKGRTMTEPGVWVDRPTHVEWVSRSPWPVVVCPTPEEDNRGYSEATHLRFMGTAEIDPALTYAFVQEYPFDHGFELERGLVAKGERDRHTTRWVSWDPGAAGRCRTVTGFEWMLQSPPNRCGHYFQMDELVSDREYGRPSRRVLLMADRCREWLEHEPPDEFEFLCGSQFLVDGKTLLTRPAEWYLDLAAKVIEDDNGAWIMERLWQEVWPRG